MRETNSLSNWSPYTSFVLPSRAGESGVFKRQRQANTRATLEQVGQDPLSGHPPARSGVILVL